MKTTIAAAALILASAAVPALAEGRGYQPNPALDGLSVNAQQRQVIVEGRNSLRFTAEGVKAQAATSQGFVPVDTTNNGVSR